MTEPASPPAHVRPTTPATPPRWMTHAPLVAVVWAFGYGALRLVWALGGAPDLPPLGEDLLLVSGWGIVGLCALAAIVVLGLPLTTGRLTTGRLTTGHLTTGLALTGLRRATGRSSGANGPILRSGRLRALGWFLVGLGWSVSAAATAAAALLLVDLVGLLFFTTTWVDNAPGALSRAGCVLGALAVGATVLTHQRRLRGGCLTCGRHIRAKSPGRAEVRAPSWARTAAYVAVLGCMTRFGAQAVVGFGPEGHPLRVNAVSGLAFLVGAAVAGTVLPLALVHRFGRVWPRWTLPLAGRRVPRWLVLGPAFVISAGMTVYFGAGLVQMIADPASMTGDSGLPPAFFWVAVPAYLAWGTGIGVAALSYRVRTRPRCRACGC
ncbi:hypothetical protein [Actinopolymorpha pittospori]|uniref:Uncharacterized protein n=1 Tax=Actinopolymorpha pittospori TaxID=648752 RepID=A0A927N2J8_9ACTN|nr:hypothetical protein [Actinopolymorpha pittospori]